MPHTDYFRRQAELCAELSDIAGGNETALRFRLLALHMLLKAADAMDDPDGTTTAGRGAPDTLRYTK